MKRLLLFALAAAAAGPHLARAAETTASPAAREIPAVLATQSAAWNRGDLAGPS